MHLLYTDEVNIDPASTEFFVYAGIAIPGDSAAPLSAEVEGLRAKYGYNPGDILKFNTAERPSQISPETHRDIKRDVILEATKHGVVLFSSSILHDIATSPEEARRNEINRICFNFDCYLGRVKDVGLVLIDTFQDAKLSGILREKFSVGLVGLPYSKTYWLRHVLGFHLSCIGSSNFCSVIDIVLGSLRYAVNERKNKEKHGVVNSLLTQLSPLCCRASSGKVSELSIFLSPKVIKSKKYLETYLELHGFLTEAGLESEQVPTDVVSY